MAPTWRDHHFCTLCHIVQLTSGTRTHNVGWLAPQLVFSAVKTYPTVSSPPSHFFLCVTMSDHMHNNECVRHGPNGCCEAERIRAAHRQVRGRGSASTACCSCDVRLTTTPFCERSAPSIRQLDTSNAKIATPPKGASLANRCLRPVQDQS